jgi:hypothetical protein
MVERKSHIRHLCFGGSISAFLITPILMYIFIEVLRINEQAAIPIILITMPIISLVFIISGGLLSSNFRYRRSAVFLFVIQSLLLISVILFYGAIYLG